jgi:hypothetical protein
MAGFPGFTTGTNPKSGRGRLLLHFWTRPVNDCEMRSQRRLDSISHFALQNLPSHLTIKVKRTWTLAFVGSPILSASNWFQTSITQHDWKGDSREEHPWVE